MLSLYVDETETSYDLTIQDKDLQAKLDSWYMRGMFRELVPFDAEQTMDQFALPARIPQPEPRIGSLFWPMFGATRYATAYYLVDHYTLGLIRNDLGDTRAVHVLFADDPDDDTEVVRSIPMFLLSSRPLSETLAGGPPGTLPEIDDLHIITLVDRRFYWQHAQGVDEADTWQPASWTALFTALLTRLGYAGADYTISAVPAEYGVPSDRWLRRKLTGYPVSHLLESAATYVGKRVVVDPADGHVTIENPRPGIITDLAAFHAAQVVANRHNSGGTLDDEESFGSVPEAVTVVFPHDPVSPTKDVTLVSAAIGEYGSHTGIAGNVLLWSDLSGTASSTIRDTLAAQLAHDWYRWQLHTLDAVYNGFVLPPARGTIGHIELHHSAFQGYTRVHRAPLVYPSTTGAIPGVSASSVFSDTCDHLVSLEDTACLKMTVFGAPTGRCRAINATQIIILNDNDDMDGVWEGTTTFTTDTGSWNVLYDWPDGSCCPRLRLVGSSSGGSTVTPRWLGCVGGKFRFLASGLLLCGEIPTVGVCGDNSFILELECIDCPNPNYAGPGWYCQATTGCGGGDIQTCVHYTSDPGLSVTLCSGPHTVEADCVAVCNVSGTSTVNCNDGTGDHVLKNTLVATCTAATGDLTCFIGVQVVLVGTGGAWASSGPVVTPCGCSTNTGFNGAVCDGVYLAALLGSAFIPWTNPPFHAVVVQTIPAGNYFVNCGTFPGYGPVSVDSSIEWTITE